MTNEQTLLDELHALIRYIYRKNTAEKIITAFAESLASKSDPQERLSIIHHWLDFYQAHKYRKMMRRRRATFQERLTACSACGYPTSHRHHLWDIAAHGENAVTVQLCPNCHELHHLLYNTLARDSDYSRKLVQHILFSGQIAPEAVQRIYGWLRAIIAYEIQNGWLESYKLSDLWIEEKLHWTEYLERSQIKTQELK